MASHVKVNISKEKLLNVLNERIKELETPTEETMSDLQKEMIKHLENLLEAVKKNENLPRADYRGEHGYGIWDSYIFRNQDGYGRNPKAVLFNEQMIAKIRKQIKLIELSDDTTFSVGINDELYELL